MTLPFIRSFLSSAFLYSRESATVSHREGPSIPNATGRNARLHDDATGAQRRLLRQYRRGSQLHDVFAVSVDHDRRGSLAAHEG